MSTASNKSVTGASTDPHTVSLKPIHIWAAIGVVALGITIYVWTRWIFGPYFHPIDVGPDPIPRAELIFLRVFEVISTICGLLFIWFYLIKPWRLEGKISWDGMMVVTLFSMYVWDPCTNYLVPTWEYNGYLINMCAWANFLPGWSSPNGQYFAEPVFLMGPCYIWFFVGPMIFGCYLLRVFRRKYPTLGLGACLAILFAGILVFDCVVEIYFLRTGAGSYPATVGALTWWAGTPHQWPLYEGVFMSLAVFAYVLLRYFRDDKGYSFCEKGADKLSLSARAKTFIRFLALAGVTHVIYLVLYFLPWNVLAPHIDSTPPYPSYMRHLVCGEGTEYVCPNAYVPIQKRTSIPIGPDDPRLPPEVRAVQDGPSYSMFAK